MKRKFSTFLILILSYSVFAQNLPLLKVSSDSSYIVTQTGKPFFWLGGTAWEMIHRLDKAGIDQYLTDRAAKGFTVIQTVVLAELDGLNTANVYGEKPLINNDPTQINEKYFELVDYVIKKADDLGLYVGLLPTWGDKYNKKWGVGPEIFNPENAKQYGAILAKRYLSHNNLIWILGGDRGVENETHRAIVRNMAKGIREIDQKHLITYHPNGGNNAIDYFNEDWLDADMFQSGHSRTVKEYSYVIKSKKSATKRPVINGEARYENILDRFWEKKYYGWLDDADVRISAYWSIISGAAGYTYGCNDIWQMYEAKRKPNLNARTDWFVALNLPGSGQMKFMKDLFEVLPWQKMKLNQDLILNNTPENESYILAAMDDNKNVMMAYTPTGKSINLDLTRMGSKKVKAYWFNPRSGKMLGIGDYETKKTQEFKPWSDGWGSDFLLLVVDATASFDFSKFE